MTGGQTILVADDEQDIRELVAYRLSRSGFSVVEARDGEEALRLATAQPLDMAVLDVMMPRLNGYQVTEQLRGMPAAHLSRSRRSCRHQERQQPAGLGHCLGAAPRPRSTITSPVPSPPG